MSIEAKAEAVRPLKVLFFSHDSKLGDAIVNTAFVAALLRIDPHCEIHATVAGATAGFWAQDPRLKRLWHVQKPGWRETVRIAGALRRERFDYIVTWHRMRSEKNRLLLWIADAASVIDLHQFNQEPVRHKIESCAEALIQMGAVSGRSGEVADRLAYDIAMPAHSSELDALLAAPREVIVVNLFAADAERNVAPSLAAQMMRGLHAQAPSAALCLVCTNDTESAARAVLAACSNNGQLVNCDGDLSRLFRLCQRADLLISPDTALVHIASAYDTPVIGIYQNNGVKAVQWGPRSMLRGVILSEHADSIAGFSVDRVLELARKLRQPGVAGRLDQPLDRPNRAVL